MITVFREQLIANTAQVFTFEPNVVEVTVINLSDSWDAFISINSPVVLDGANSIIIPAGTGRSFRLELTTNYNVPIIQYVSVISEGNPLIQIDGTR